MKRLVVITVGKIHSRKTTFVQALEKELDNARLKRMRMPIEY
ncbi:hypothetical protein ACDX78_08300 [Virgibacillus oceani]